MVSNIAASVLVKKLLRSKEDQSVESNIMFQEQELDEYFIEEG